MTEDQILTSIAIDDALNKLEPAYRIMMVLIYGRAQPDDWTAAWPPRLEDIGRYVGLRFGGKPLSEAAIRYRRDLVLDQWAGKRRKLRRPGKRRDV